MRAKNIQEFLDAQQNGRWRAERWAGSWAALAEAAARSLMEREDDLAARVAEMHGFSAFESRRAARGALELIRAADLMRLWESQFGRGSEELKSARWPELAVVFGGGAIPQPSVQAVIAAGMVARRVVFRPSSEDPFLAGRVVEEMAEMQSRGAVGLDLPQDFPSVAERAMCMSWPRSDTALTRGIVGRADSVTIFGGEEAVEEIGGFARVDCQRFVYGPRLSFVVMDLGAGTRDQRDERDPKDLMDREDGGETQSESRDKELGDGGLDIALSGLAEDMFAFDQRGCLSPSVLYLIGGDAEAEARALDALGRALDERAKAQGYAPRIPASAAHAIHSLRAIYSMDPTGMKSCRMSAGLPGLTLLIDRDDRSLRPTPGYQTIYVARLGSWEELPRAIEESEIAPQAMAIGPGREPCPAAVISALRGLGLSRVCEPGRMQAPPLDWVHDGNPIFPWRL